MSGLKGAELRSGLRKGVAVKLGLKSLLSQLRLAQRKVVLNLRSFCVRYACPHFQQTRPVEAGKKEALFRKTRQLSKGNVATLEAI